MCVYRKLTVKINCNGELSSGFIIKNDDNDSGIVVCSRHGLADAKENIGNFNNYTEVVKIIDYSGDLLKVTNIIFSDSLDICLIEVNTCNNYPTVYPMMDVERESDVTIFGYPSIHRDDRGILYATNLTAIEGETVEVRCKTSLLTYENDEVSNVKGLSGSMMYIEENNYVYFIGLVVEVIPENNSFRGIYSKEIVAMVEEKCKYKFLPNKDFAEIFEILSERISKAVNVSKAYTEYFLKQFKKVVIDELSNTITPKQIAESNRQLWLEKNNEKLEQDIWIGWLFVILIDYYYSDKSLYTEYNSADTSKYIYMTNATSAADVIKILANNESIKNNDLIFLSNFKARNSNIGFSQRKLGRIVNKIDDFSVGDKLYIDDESHREFSGIDIEEFYKLLDNYLLEEDKKNYSKNFSCYIKSELERLIYEK